MLVGGFSKNFSIETIGPQPDPETGIYYNAELVGLSQVVTQNKYNAHINQVVYNSLEQAKQDGLDITGVEAKVMNAIKEDKMEDKDKNVKAPVVETPEVETPEVVEAPEVVETPEVEAPKETSEVEEVKEETEVTEVEVPAEVEAPAETEVETPAEEQPKQTETETEVNATDDTVVETVEEKTENNKETQMDKILTAEQIAEIVANAIAPLSAELAEVKADAKNAFDASAKAL